MFYRQKKRGSRVGEQINNKSWLTLTLLGLRVKKNGCVKVYSRDLDADVAANSGEYEKNERKDQ